MSTMSKRCVASTRALGYTGRALAGGRAVVATSANCARSRRWTMSARGRISRRGLLGAAAALGAASVAGPAASARMVSSRRTAARPAAQLPARGEFAVRNAHVLTMGPTLDDLERGDVHVRDGTIVGVGTDLAAPGAEVIDGRGMIALPGLIDTHWHLWNSQTRNLVA